MTVGGGVLVVGGDTAGEIRDDVLWFYLATQTWEVLPAPPGLRSVVRDSDVGGGTVLAVAMPVVGGYVTAEGTPDPPMDVQVHRFDPEDRSWTPVGPPVDAAWGVAVPSPDGGVGLVTAGPNDPFRGYELRDHAWHPIAEGGEAGVVHHGGDGFVPAPVWTSSRLLIPGTPRELVAYDPVTATFARSGYDRALDGFAAQPVWTGEALVMLVNQDSEGWVWRPGP